MLKHRPCVLSLLLVAVWVGGAAAERIPDANPQIVPPTAQWQAAMEQAAANGQETWPSIKAFGDGDLSLGKGDDVGQGDRPKRSVATGQSPVIQRIAYVGTGLDRLVTMSERVSGVRDQAAFR